MDLILKPAHSQTTRDGERIVQRQLAHVILSVWRLDDVNCTDPKSADVRNMWQLNILHWSPEHRFAFLATTIFGGCIGVVIGLRRIDAAAMQDYYWLWLALWVGSGALLGAAAGFIYQYLRRLRT